jgi:hypothetical protein
LKKGLIMTIDQKYAYVFTRDCRMEKIIWQPGMAVGQEISLEREPPDTPVRAFPRRRAVGLALAAACLVVLIGVSLPGLLFSPVYARLSVDVNPSLELSLNRRLEVRSVRVIGEDARAVLGGEHLEGLPWKDAVARWSELLQQHGQGDIQTMLLAAVLPAAATTFRNQLLDMASAPETGIALQIRVIYSHDQSVANMALQNGLSVGRQMLLTLAQQQDEPWTAQSIAAAPLGDLVRQLLRDGQADQAGLTKRTTQSAADPTGTSMPSGTSSGTGSQTSGPHTSRLTQQESSGSQGSTAGSQVTSRQTSQESESSRQTSGTGPAGSSMTAGGEPDGSSQQTSNVTVQTSGPGSGTNGS